MIRLLLLVIIFQSSSAFALSTSLTWQKLSLEEKVQRKFNSTLSSVLKDNQYLVEVEAEISEPGSPNFGNDDKKSGPRVSDLNMADSRGDYIAFSKVGLEMPVVDKFLDEDRTKLVNLYRFNESYDIFKNLTAMNVTVFLSDKIPQDLSDIVKKLINNSKFSVSGIKPVIKFENITMEWVDPSLNKKPLPQVDDANKKKEKEVEPKIWLKDWLEWASRWGNAFGLILGTLIFGFIAFSLFKRWKEFMEALASMRKPDEEQKKNEEDPAMMTMAPQQQETTQEEDMAAAQGFERFQQCLEQHPDDAINIIRFWINECDEQSILALRAISQLASAAEMEKLMSGLSDPQRSKWKSVLGKHLEPQELVVANKHIFQEVIKAFLVPSRIKDGELLNLVMELNAKSCCDFLAKYEDQIGIMMNLLSPALIGRIITEISEQQAEAWLMAGTEFKVQDIDRKVPDLKNALKSYNASYAPSPFSQRIISMIPTAAPSRELTLYRALAKAGNSGMIMEVAKNNFPSELILSLPGQFLKEVIQSYPVSKRVELIYSRSMELKLTLLDMLAEKGTPARDLMDMELENVKNDPTTAASIEGQSEEIWFEFVKSCRNFLNKNTAYAGLTDQLIKEWSQKLKPRLQGLEGGKAA